MAGATVWAFDARTVDRSGLNEAQAREVLALVLRHDQVPPDASVEVLTGAGGLALFAGYLAYGVSIDSPSAGASTPLGMYAVSLRTGDVWETNRCQRASFPTLTALQRAIRARTLTSLADERAQRRGLGCE